MAGYFYRDAPEYVSHIKEEYEDEVAGKQFRNGYGMRFLR